MIIRNEQLQALQQQPEVKAKSKGSGSVFDAILSEEIASASPKDVSAGEALARNISSPVGITPLAEGSSVAGAGMLGAAAQSIDAMLGNLDAYAETLSSPQGADLRKAYGLLQNMGRDLEALRQSTPDLAVRHAGLASLVDELSVIAQAETIKMNRGDYL